MCTPLPTRSGSGFGEKITRWPSRCAVARAISRVITAWSAAVSAGCGMTVTSNWRAPYSARKVSGNHPGRAQRGDEALAESALAAEGAEGVGVARTVRGAGVEELLLERGDQAKARHLFELLDGAAQEIARAAFPGGAVGIADVAEKEMLDRRAVAKIDPHFGGGVGHDHEIAGGAERRVPDRPERRHHQIAAGPADALLEPQPAARAPETLCRARGPRCRKSRQKSALPVSCRRQGDSSPFPIDVG